MSDESFLRNQGADPGLPGSDTGEPVCPAGEGGEPLQEPRTFGPQVLVSSAVEAKKEELGRQPTPGEVDFVRIQVERDEILAEFPQVEDCSEEVKKRLKSLKNVNVLKKQSSQGTYACLQTVLF